MLIIFLLTKYKAKSGWSARFTNKEISQLSEYYSCSAVPIGMHGGRETITIYLALIKQLGSRISSSEFITSCFYVKILFHISNLEIKFSF